MSEVQTTNQTSNSILVVDDDEWVLEAAIDILELLGHSAIPALGGTKAVEIYTESHQTIDIIMIDMKMPDIAGPELYQLLVNISADFRTIVCSGLAVDNISKQFCETALELRKPYRIETLEATIVEARSSHMASR